MDGQQCPYEDCKRWCVKVGCTYIIACGLDEHGVFHVGKGCGRAFCFACGKKYCEQQYDPNTGIRSTTFRSQHDTTCCTREQGFQQSEYCEGGHNPHCPKRW